MQIVKKKRGKVNVRTRFIITRVTEQEHKDLTKRAGGKGNISIMLRILLGLENTHHLDNYIPPQI